LVIFRVVTELYQKECQEIDWDAKGISFTDPRTTETELQVQSIIDLQNIANNLPDAFIDHKGVTKSLHPARNVSERVEVPNKTTQPQFGKKRGRSTFNKQDLTIDKQRHLKDTYYPSTSSVMRINTEAGTAENPRSIILGNHDESLRVDEISINFTETGESYNRKSIIVDVYLSKEIANIIQTDTDPKSIAECKKHSDWDNWKIEIQTEIASLHKREVFLAVMPTPLVSSMWDTNGFLSAKGMKTTKW